MSILSAAAAACVMTVVPASRLHQRPDLFPGCTFWQIIHLHVNKAVGSLRDFLQGGVGQWCMCVVRGGGGGGGVVHTLHQYAIHQRCRDASMMRSLA